MVFGELEILLIIQVGHFLDGFQLILCVRKYFLGLFEIEEACFGGATGVLQNLVHLLIMHDDVYLHTDHLRELHDLLHERLLTLALQINSLRMIFNQLRFILLFFSFHSSFEQVLQISPCFFIILMEIKLYVQEV